MRSIVLIIEENDKDYHNIRQQLTLSGFAPDNLVRCFSVHDAIKLNSDCVTAILADFFHHGGDYTHSLSPLQFHFRYVPVIGLLHPEHEEFLLPLVRQGVQDCLIYGCFNADDLKRTITFAVERMAITAAREHKETDYKLHFDNGPMPMWIVDSESMRFVDVNKTAIAKYGYSKEEFLALKLTDIRPKEDQLVLTENFKKPKSNYFNCLSALGEWFFRGYYVVERHWSCYHCLLNHPIE